MTESRSTDRDAIVAALHADALAAAAEEREEEAYAILRNALFGEGELEAINDLAVIAHRLGRTEQAQAILSAVLAIEPGRADARTNLDAIRGRVEATSGNAGWRSSRTLGGADPNMPERAFPGMPSATTLTEHCWRYAFAQTLAHGRRVLDLGCGTGYGSEMLSWAAASVRGYDLWNPDAAERPSWPGVTQLNYGHDLCKDPLPRAEVAVMFEVIEHLPDAPAALTIAWQAVPAIIASFPNPAFHGSWINHHHVNDWSLDTFESELSKAARTADLAIVELHHLHQLAGGWLIPGRNPAAPYWLIVAQASAA